MSGSVVADASVLVKWFVPEDFYEQAWALRDDHLFGRVRVVAPCTAPVEVASALRKYVARGFLDAGRALRALELLWRTEVGLVGVDEGLLRAALEFSLARGVSVYDALYVALARSLGTVVYTADERLLRSLGGEEPVRHIRDYNGSSSAPGSERQAR
ncbi:type II toxin-antitoxin system VapC family toxin [Infirmifilum sp. NZ]|uniref:type II toxin-antitoxin system VapC family toxin n=1 Tax=Infirmifilum sp. NZ TaxID=2926850 RepID=UPI0027A21EF5|nr:type II toxin-antitoxin system VapC family toxin [Infirmifilum sp. NZ]UNQ73784.1 type II toxin-antitoxin system VapC family toxin [Infirmifilum sp. NZ]